MSNLWRKCSVCKADISQKSRYYECSVSTCNGKRTGIVFCSVSCFDRHLPGARHKDAAAIENTAPAQAAEPEAPKRRIISSAPKTVSHSSVNTSEILVVVSKLKKYVQDRAGMNTSQSVMDVLSNKLRRICDEAIQEANKEGRKTLMDRDFK